MKKICVYKALKKSKTPNPSVLMYQLIPAVNTPPGDPRGFAHPFAQAPGFYLEICAQGPGV